MAPLAALDGNLAVAYIDMHFKTAPVMLVPFAAGFARAWRSFEGRPFQPRVGAIKRLSRIMPSVEASSFVG